MSKNDNILDSVDKNTGPRTCPECGYQFPFLLFVKRYVLKFGFPKWTCPNCREFIKYNYFKSNLIGAVVFIVCVFSFLGLESKYEWDPPIFIILIGYFFFGLILLSFDRLEKFE